MFVGEVGVGGYVELFWWLWLVGVDGVEIVV